MANNLPFGTANGANGVREEGVVDHLTAGIGRKIFLLTPQFPFMFIGIITDVVDDFVVIDVETTHVQQLENRSWAVHVEQIEVFFIERDDGPRIPELRE